MGFNPVLHSSLSATERMLISVLREISEYWEFEEKVLSRAEEWWQEGVFLINIPTFCSECIL